MIFSLHLFSDDDWQAIILIGSGMNTTKSGFVREKKYFTETQMLLNYAYHNTYLCRSYATSIA